MREGIGHGDVKELSGGGLVGGKGEVVPGTSNAAEGRGKRD
jgi:hypothetical protein